MIKKVRGVEERKENRELYKFLIAPSHRCVHPLIYSHVLYLTPMDFFYSQLVAACIMQTGCKWYHSLCVNIYANLNYFSIKVTLNKRETVKTQQGKFEIGKMNIKKMVREAQNIHLSIRVKSKFRLQVIPTI